MEGLIVCVKLKEMWNTQNTLENDDVQFEFRN
jgi:hypothetical protein